MGRTTDLRNAEPRECSLPPGARKIVDALGDLEFGPPPQHAVDPERMSARDLHVTASHRSWLGMALLDADCCNEAINRFLEDSVKLSSAAYVIQDLPKTVSIPPRPDAIETAKEYALVLGEICDWLARKHGREDQVIVSSACIDLAEFIVETIDALADRGPSVESNEPTGDVG